FRAIPSPAAVARTSTDARAKPARTRARRTAGVDPRNVPTVLNRMPTHLDWGAACRQSKMAPSSRSEAAHDGHVTDLSRAGNLGVPGADTCSFLNEPDRRRTWFGLANANAELGQGEPGSRGSNRNTRNLVRSRTRERWAQPRRTRFTRFELRSA